MKEEDFLSNIADAVDRRRNDMTYVERVVSHHKGTTLEQTASIMALPVIYAHWEGFVKEALLQYIEFIEKKNLLPEEAHPTIFSFSIKKHLRKIETSSSVDNITEFASWLVANKNSVIKFEDKVISTKGNLSYGNLKDLCDRLKIDVCILEMQKRKIDALLHRRNNIAHTGRPPDLSIDNIKEEVGLVLNLIETFESILGDCIKYSRYKINNCGDPSGGI